MTNGSRASRLLLLIRHGQAVPKNVGLDDFERVLTSAGRKESARHAQVIAQAGHRIDHICSSPADRALETAHAFADRLDYPIEKIRIAPSFYLSTSIKTLIGDIGKLDKSIRCAAYVGHSPALDRIAAHFVSGFAGPIQKGSVVGIKIDSASWAAAHKGVGSLSFITGSAIDRKRKSAAPRHRQPRS